MSLRTFFLTVFTLLWLLPAPAAVPGFHTAAAARDWGEAQERAGHFDAAAEAYEREAILRRATGDPQGAEVEHRRARRLETDLALAVPGPVLPTRHLAKWEPTAGCYLGVLDGDGGSADDFAQRAGRPLALAFEYDAYGRPVPRTLGAAAGRPGPRHPDRLGAGRHPCRPRRRLPGTVGR